MLKIRILLYFYICIYPVSLFGEWEYKSPLYFGRGGLVCEVVNGKIYAITGRRQNDILTKICEEYDPQLNRWTIKESIPTARYGAVSGVVGNKIYVIGGDTNTNFRNSSATNVIEVYDPIRDTWETVNSVWPIPHSGAAGTVIGDWIYVMGGVLYTGPHNIYFDTVQAYNPITNQWVVKRSMNTPRAYFDAAACSNYVYACGGQFINNLIKRCERFDTTTNNWDSIRSLPRSRDLFASVAYERKIFVIGGVEGNINMVSGSVYYQDPNSGEWISYDSINQPRYRHDAVIIGNDIYVIGGKDLAFNYLATVEHTVFVGIEEEEDTSRYITTQNLPTFIPAGKNPYLNKQYQLFDITGQKINSTILRPGLYFLLSKCEKVRKIIVY